LLDRRDLKAHSCEGEAGAAERKVGLEFGELGSECGRVVERLRHHQPQRVVTAPTIIDVSGSDILKLRVCEDVVAIAASDHGAAGTAVQAVVPVAAIQSVVTRSAGDQVVAVAAADRVIAAATGQNVGAIGSVDDGHETSLVWLAIRSGGCCRGLVERWW